MTEMQQDIGQESTGAQIENAAVVNIGTNSKRSNGIPKHLTLLPAINPNFVGREKELQQIQGDLASTSMVYIVNGIGGIGKSELACKYLLDHVKDYQHIALFEFSAGNSSNTLEDVFIKALKQSLSLGENITLEGILYRLQRLPEKCLLVFDNLLNKADIEKLKPLNNNCDVLISTRLQVSSEKTLNLDILPPKDARALFQKHYTTTEDIDDILEYIDYHSLFIELIAKTLQEECLSLDELRNKFQQGEFTKIDRDFEQTFNDFLIQRFQIEENAQLKSLLQLLALLPSVEIQASTLAEIFKGDDRLNIKLSELVKRGWLIHKADKYKLHQIIKEFILANHHTTFDDARSLIDNINAQLDPNDSFLNAIEKIHYIEIVESILRVYAEQKNALTASLFDALCNLYYALGRYNKAVVLQQTALTMRKEVLGGRHPDTASSYNNMATVYNAQGNYPKALELYQKSLAIRKEVLGGRHPDTATSYNNMAGVYDAQGNYPKALELYQKSLAIREEVLGGRHPATASSYNNLAAVYHAQGNYSKALELYQKSLAINEEVLGGRHPDTAKYYNNMAAVYHAKGNYPKALELYQKSLAIREEVLGGRHPDTASSYNNLAGVYNAQGNYPKALELFQKSLAIREEVLGGRHPATASSYTNIAHLFLRMKQCTKANSYALKAFAIFDALELRIEISKVTQLLNSIKHTIKKARKKPRAKRHKVCKDLID